MVVEEVGSAGAQASRAAPPWPPSLRPPACAHRQQGATELRYGSRTCTKNLTQSSLHAHARGTRLGTVDTIGRQKRTRGERTQQSRA